MPEYIFIIIDFYIIIKTTLCYMIYRGAFSLTKTATGILFKFSNIEDFQAVFKKGFHKVTGARFYKKVNTLPYQRIFTP